MRGGREKGGRRRNSGCGQGCDRGRQFHVYNDNRELPKVVKVVHGSDPHRKFSTDENEKLSVWEKKKTYDIRNISGNGNGRTISAPAK